MNRKLVMKFVEVLEVELVKLWDEPEYQIVRKRSTVKKFAIKMVKALQDGTASITGKGVKNTCKALGIKCTYKQIQDYLANEVVL